MEYIPYSAFSRNNHSFFIKFIGVKPLYILGTNEKWKRAVWVCILLVAFPCTYF